MVYRRKMGVQKGRVVKRGRGKMGRRKMNISRPIQSKVITYTRKSWYQNWVPTTTTIGGYWRQFNLTFGTLPNCTEFQALFDQYKLNRVKLTLIPRYDSFAGNDTTDTTLPGVTNQGGVYVHVLNDPYATNQITGAYSSTTLNQFMENGNVRTYTGNKPINIYYKPCIQRNVQDAFLQIFDKPMYLPTTQPNINHFGPQVFVQDQNLTGVFGQSFDVFITWYFTFKNLK